MGKAVWRSCGTVAMVVAGRVRSWAERRLEVGPSRRASQVLSRIGDLIPLATEKSGTDLICILTLFAF